MIKPRQFTATITCIQEIAPLWYLASFSWPRNLAPPQPGQFFTYNPSLLPGAGKSLLRKPLAFAGFEDQHAYTIFQARGEGTKALAQLDLGEKLDIIAPLGNGFPIPNKEEKAFIVGGGIGLGPMLYLASDFLSNHLDFEVVLGFRTMAQVPNFSACAKNALIAMTAQEIISAASIATDDGSSGFKGTAVDLLKKTAFGPSNTPDFHSDSAKQLTKIHIHLFGCGPFPMLKALHDLATQYQLPAHVSTEQWMACGVGACHGCVLPASGGGYVRVCADGPVFSSDAIDWGKCP